MVQILLMILEENFETKVNKFFVVDSFMPTFAHKSQCNSFTSKISSFHMDCSTNHMFNDMYMVVLLIFFYHKHMWTHMLDYNLIIIIITIILTNVRCEFFKMSKLNHLTMLLTLLEIHM